MSDTWAAVTAAFLAELTHTRRLSPLTVKAYRRELTILAQAFPEGPAATDAPALRRELARAHGVGLSGRSLARRLSAWRTFFIWFGRQRGAPHNPARGLRAPRSAKRLPAVLGIEAAMRLVQGETGEEPSEWLRVQDDAMFELFYSSGLRLAELVGLDLDRLDLTQGLVTVIGKGQRSRTVPVGSAACSALARWLARRAQVSASPDATAVFLSRRGKRIAPRTVQERLARRGQSLGLPQRVHPHMLRHSCASHVLQSSADLRAVQELLGHASIASTQIYTHLDFQHLAQAYDAAHPRARRPSPGAPNEIPSPRPIRPANK
jgi:integrase/recombinase XerC